MRRPILLGLLVLSLVAGGASMKMLHESQRAPSPALGKDGRAFLHSRWGMTPQEVEKANNVTILPVADNRRFYNDAEPGEAGRYRSYENRDARFLGWAATVTYTFRDDRLFAYHVFVTDVDGERLNADMRGYLKRSFGEGASEPDDGSSLRLIWQSKERIVNYWYMEDDLSLLSKYTAGFGVTRIAG